MYHLITANARILTPKGYHYASEFELNQEIITYNYKTRQKRTDHIQSIRASVIRCPKLLNCFAQLGGTYLLNEKDEYVPAREGVKYKIYNGAGKIKIDYPSYKLGEISVYVINNLLFRREDENSKLYFKDNNGAINVVHDFDLEKINDVILNKSEIVDLYSFYMGYINSYERFKRESTYKCWFGEHLYQVYKEENKKYQETRQLVACEQIAKCALYSFKTSNYRNYGIIVNGFIVQQ